MTDGPGTSGGRPVLPEAAGHRSGTFTQPHVVVPFSSAAAPRVPIGRRISVPQLPGRSSTTQGRRGRLSPAGRRRALQAVAAVMVLALTAVGWQAIRGPSGADPRELVQRLFDRLAARDISDWATGTLCAKNPICGPGALSSGYEPPQQVTIDAVTDQADGKDRSATVDVSYNVAGQRVHDQVTAEYSPGRLFGGYWLLRKRPFTTLTIPGPSPTRVTVAAVKLLPAELTGPLTIKVPPGRYTISRAETPLIAATETATVAAPGQSATVALPTDVLAAVHDDVVTLIDSRIDDCAAQHDFRPEAGTARPRVHTCPFAHDTRYTITDNPTWTVQQYPQLQVIAGTDGSISVTTTAPGRVVIRYRWTEHLVEPRTWTDVEATEPIVVTGRITGTAGALAWQPG
ncbi:hypothetical protein ACPPVO_36490 [Dactylosporangium sp. McL0621]|uniref:hypothetical protein n=1 Tax=Dactylosporangium sp. McL0621 TaxID=3415678 RepID=UPI003CF18636